MVIANFFESSWQKLVKMFEWLWDKLKHIFSYKRITAPMEYYGSKSGNNMKGEMFKLTQDDHKEINAGIKYPSKYPFKTKSRGGHVSALGKNNIIPKFNKEIIQNMIGHNSIDADELKKKAGL